MNKITEDRIVARDCPICKRNGRIFIHRMKKNFSGIYYCDGCGNSLTGDKLKEASKELNSVEDKVIEAED